jgi:phosphopantothenoylcysteine decarboxylase / phosphopantothenate---cysteine ligase
LGRSAHLILIAPATANTIAHLAHGFADNLLGISALSSNCPLLIAPEMDAVMYNHPATQANIQTLTQSGTYLIGPTPVRSISSQASWARMAEPADILDQVRYMLSRQGPLTGKKILVTAGATQEPLDPVRFVTNRSTGRQGYAIAQAAVDAGAEVVLVSTSTILSTPTGVKKVAVRTADEMFHAVMHEAVDTHVLVMAASVADFRPISVSNQKLKRQFGAPEIDFEPTTDILAAVGARRAESGYPNRVIGFAAETQDLLENALAKLAARNLDMIVASDVSALDNGLDMDNNLVSLVFADGRTEVLPLMTKMQVAENLIHKIVTWLNE